MDVAAGGEDDLIGQHRLQLRPRPILFRAQALARPGAGQAGGGAHRPRRGLAGGGEFGARVEAQLGRLLLPVRPLHHIPNLQRAPGNFQPGEPLPLVVPGNFEHPGGKLRRPVRLQGVPRQAVQQRVHPLHPQRRAEKAGEQPTLHNQGGQVRVIQLPRLQVALHQRLIAQSGVLQHVLPRAGKVGAAVAQPRPELAEQPIPLRARLIHLVDEEEGGDMVALQQLPQGLGVPLHPVRTADQQHRAVHHLHRPLRLGGEVHVARGVQQGELPLPPAQPGLLGEDGDAPLPLLLLGIQKGVAVVHPAQPAHRPGAVQHRLGQGGFARVHMGQHPDGQPLHLAFSSRRSVRLFLN